MKQIMVGTALALLGLCPVIASAACGVDHASMASSTPAKSEQAQAAAASKAPQPAVAKATVKEIKPVAVKKTVDSAPKADGSAVVARTN